MLLHTYPACLQAVFPCFTGGGQKRNQQPPHHTHTQKKSSHGNNWVVKMCVEFIALLSPQKRSSSSASKCACCCCCYASLCYARRRRRCVHVSPTSETCVISSARKNLHTADIIEFFDPSLCIRKNCRDSLRGFAYATIIKIKCKDNPLIRGENNGK